MKYYVTVAGRERLIEIQTGKEGTRVLVDLAAHPSDIAEVEGAGLFSLLVDGHSHQYGARFENGEAVLSFHDREVQLRIEDERTRLARQATGGGRATGGSAELKSVMPGVVKELRLAEGEEVGAGQALLILEAMKMENEIRCPSEGTVVKVHVAPGDAVDKGALLVSIEGRPAPEA